MRYWFGLLLAGLLTACSTAQVPATTTPSAVAPVMAVYLVRDTSELDAADLAQHPEVAVVHSMADVQKLAIQPVALWFDRNALDLVDRVWLTSQPAASYPVVVVGYHNPVYAFREALAAFEIEGPAINWQTTPFQGGFSVWQRRSASSTSTNAFMQGYDQPPTVVGIKQVLETLKP